MERKSGEANCLPLPLRSPAPFPLQENKIQARPKCKTRPVSRLASAELGAREERGGDFSQNRDVAVAELQEDSIGGRTLLLSFISSCRSLNACFARLFWDLLIFFFKKKNKTKHNIALLCAGIHFPSQYGGSNEADQGSFGPGDRERF